MVEKGVIHEIIWDHLLDRAFHLELRCVPCLVEVSPGQTVKTRQWLSKQYLKQTLDLIAVALNKRVLNSCDDGRALEQVAAAANNSDVEVRLDECFLLRHLKYFDEVFFAC